MTIQDYTTLYNTILYDTILRYTTLYNTIRHYTRLYHTIDYTTLYDTVPYITIQHYTTLYETIQFVIQFVLYRIYKLSPSTRVCISDTTQPLMLLTLHTTLYDTIAHYTTLTYNTKCTFIVLKRLQQDFSFHLQCSLYKNVCQTWCQLTTCKLFDNNFNFRVKTFNCPKKLNS
jgi:hypothetical protein